MSRWDKHPAQKCSRCEALEAELMACRERIGHLEMDVDYHHDGYLLDQELIHQLRELLAEAAVDVETWGQYAGAYFMSKWNLDGDVQRYRDASQGKVRPE